MARHLVIYDLVEPDEPAIALVTLSSRGEYEFLNALFDDGAYRYREVPLSEFETIREMTKLPIKRIVEFCLTPVEARREVWRQHEQ